MKAISGVHTVRFKNELVRNITIKLGYANAKVMSCILNIYNLVSDLFVDLQVRQPCVPATWLLPILLVQQGREALVRAPWLWLEDDTAAPCLVR